MEGLFTKETEILKGAIIMLNKIGNLKDKIWVEMTARKLEKEAKPKKSMDEILREKQEDMMWAIHGPNAGA